MDFNNTSVGLGAVGGRTPLLLCVGIGEMRVVGLHGLHPQALPLEMVMGGGGLACGSILTPQVHPLSYGMGQALVFGWLLSLCWSQVAVCAGPGLVFFFTSTKKAKPQKLVPGEIFFFPETVTFHSLGSFISF